jgi:hypothetical protein
MVLLFDASWKSWEKIVVGKIKTPAKKIKNRNFGKKKSCLF